MVVSAVVKFSPTVQCARVARALGARYVCNESFVFYITVLLQLTRLIWFLFYDFCMFVRVCKPKAST